MDEGSRASTEIDAASSPFLVGLHRLQSMFRLRYDPSAMRNEFAAGWSGGGALADPLDQLKPTAVFQLANLLADGRLGQMQALRCLGEAAELDNFDQ